MLRLKPTRASKEVMATGPSHQDRSSWGQQGHLSQKPRRTNAGSRREIVHRTIPGTSEKETTEGTFIPVAGSEEECVAKWLNGITNALLDLLPKSAVPAPTIPATTGTRRIMRSAITRHRRCWSSETSRKPIKDTLMLWKPDVILRDSLPPGVFGPQHDFSWKDVISFVELSSTSYSKSTDLKTVRNNVMRKAYAVFASQPGRRFLFALSIANKELHAHMFDRSGVVHSRPYNIHHFPRPLLCMLALLGFGNPEHVGYDPTFIYFSPSSSELTPTGSIQVRLLVFKIINRIFFNFLICGRGTSCWHVCLDDQDYVIKDSWTHVSRMNREQDILNKIHGVKGVPQLITAWIVEIAGSDDRTDAHRSSFPSLSGIHIHQQLVIQPVGRPLSDFKSIRELLSVLIDILDSTSKHPLYLLI